MSLTGKTTAELRDELSRRQWYHTISLPNGLMTPGWFDTRSLAAALPFPDLAGKRIGLIDFQQTAALWLRGLLADEYDVPRESIHWITAGLHAPVLDDRMAMTLPPGIRVQRSSETLDALFRSGAIDAVISPTAPRSLADPAVPVAQLWPDHRPIGISWLRWWSQRPRKGP